MRLALPIAVLLAGLTATTWGFVALVEVDTCASGGPYEIAQPCPEGTGAKAAVLGGGIALAVAGMIWLGIRSASLGVAGFGLVFVVLGGAFLAGEIVPIGSGVGGAGWICGPLFMLMGLPPLAGGLRAALQGRHEPRRRQDAFDLVFGRAR